MWGLGKNCRFRLWGLGCDGAEIEASDPSHDADDRHTLRFPGSRSRTAPASGNVVTSRKYEPFLDPKSI